MELHKKIKSGITIGCIKGDIDIDTSAKLKRWLGTLLKTKPKEIVLNFSNVDFIDSLGIATLIWFLKEVKKIKSTVVLCNISPKIRSLFSITKLDRVFKIFTLENEAIAGFSCKDV